MGKTCFMWEQNRRVYCSRIMAPAMFAFLVLLSLKGEREREREREREADLTLIHKRHIKRSGTQNASFSLDSVTPKRRTHFFVQCPPSLPTELLVEQCYTCNFFFSNIILSF